MKLHKEENLKARDEILGGMVSQYGLGHLGFIFAWLLAITILGTFSYVHADEKDSTKDKAVETGHDMKRGAKKMVHRTGEALCAEGDAACLAKKGKNRVKEGADYVGDKVDEKTSK